MLFLFFFFNDTATTEIYTLSLHDALPIWPAAFRACCAGVFLTVCGVRMATSCALSSHAGWRGGSALLSHQTVEDRCSKCILPFPGFPALALPSPFPCG